jgi:hypothetical protein
MDATIVAERESKVYPVTRMYNGLSHGYVECMALYPDSRQEQVHLHLVGGTNGLRAEFFPQAGSRRGVAVVDTTRKVNGSKHITSLWVKETFLTDPDYPEYGGVQARSYQILIPYDAWKAFSRFVFAVSGENLVPA